MILDEWREALLEDGWDVEAIYGNRCYPDVSLQFERDGWKIHIYRHTDSMAEDIMAFGPDRLGVTLPKEYDFGQMEANLLLCDRCGEYVQMTVRLGFGERVCIPCRAEHLSEVEYPGWNS